MDDHLKVNDSVPASINRHVNVPGGRQMSLRRTIRELDSRIASDTLEIGKALAHEIGLLEKALEQRQQIVQWQKWLVCALEAGDDNLARKALARKQECSDAERLLCDQLIAAQNSGIALRRQVEELKVQKEIAKADLTKPHVRNT